MNEEQMNPCPQGPNSYETGNTTPPKSRVLFVFFLVLLIFLGGVVTTLGFLNITLLSAFSLEKEEVVPLKFTRVSESTVPTFAAAPPQKTDTGVGFGVATETVSPFICTYYNLPRGVCLPSVPENSGAYAAGIRSGDILLSVDGQITPHVGALDSLLQGYQPGDTVTLTLFRKGQELSVELTLVTTLPEGE